MWRDARENVMSSANGHTDSIWFGTWMCVCALLALVPPASGGDAAPRPRAATAESDEPASSRRRVLFGELHLHTSYSFDAYGFSPSRVDPDAAYRFARGEAIDYLGKSVRRHAPLDFMAVTDHAEYMGFLNRIDDPQSELSGSAFAREYRALKESLDPGALTRQVLKKLADPEQLQALGANAAMRSAWQRTIEAANANYRPGEFTTFIGYEWTSHPDDRYNLHRNVIFRGDSAPEPFSATDSKRPEDLWRYLEGNRARGIDVLAIPHNSNASEGRMFDWTDSDGKPIDAAYARRRARNEPLVEIYQGKGQSETHPALSPNDEFAQFEILDRLVPRLDLPGKPPGSYVREALGRGLAIEQRTGENPYRFGVVAATDFHNGLATSAEDAFALADGFDAQVNPPGREQARAYLKEPATTVPDPKLMGSGGLTGVWAERNTRDAIFAALERRETFGTSGTRIQLRLFGGWTYPVDMLERRDWLERAYREGVPMGSDLPPPPASGAPVFLIWVLKAPDGANLDRAQIVKVWLDGDTAREMVFDAALSDGNRLGAAQFLQYWRDPEFDPLQPAVYYLRALEIETPRWTTLLAARHELAPPQGSPATVRERAWSSPIWYRPPATAR
jgi:hypothetical protein